MVIEGYFTKRLTKLTKFSDKLVALSGLASDLGRSWDGVDYLAGLWSSVEVSSGVVVMTPLCGKNPTQHRLSHGLL